MKYLDNPIQGNSARINESVDYYSRVSNMLDHALDITSYIWCESNSSAAINAMRAKFDGILEKIIYASAYYSEVAKTLRKYSQVLQRYRVTAQNLVDEHNAIAKKNALDTEQVYVSLGMMQAQKSEPEMRLEKVVRDFDSEAGQIASTLEQKVLSYLDNAKMRDSFFEDVTDMITGFIGFLRRG